MRKGERGKREEEGWDGEESKGEGGEKMKGTCTCKKLTNNQGGRTE